jgi:hypothetical protein
MKNLKMMLILILASLSIVVFAGCSTKKIEIVQKPPTATNITNNTTNTTDTKTIYSNVLKKLVNEKKITQTQSDKVLEEVTSNKPLGTQATNQNETNANTNTNTDINTNMNNGTGITNSTGTTKDPTTNNGLSKLVSSGVITQAQAALINQRIQEAAKSK